MWVDICLVYGFTMIDVCGCIWLFAAFAAKRRAGNKFLAPACAILDSGLICAFANIFFFDRFCLKVIAVMVVLSVSMYLLFGLRYGKALVLTALFYGVALAADYASLVVKGTVLGTAFPEGAWESADFFAFYVAGAVGKLLMLGMIFCIRKLVGSKMTGILTVREWCALAAIACITIIAVATIAIRMDWVHYASRPVDLFHSYMAGGILLINLLGYYLIHSIVEREIKAREYAIFREKIKSETAAYRAVSENLDRHKKRTHEYKNQLAAISALAAAGQYEELTTYIAKIESGLRRSADAVDTNHVIVNAILNTKYRDAVNNGIVFVLKVNDLSDLKIEEEDIVIILSNLLDNALEACAHSEDKVVKIKLALEGEQVVISVKNSMETQPMVENGAFLTSKTEDADDHGMGIRNVIETVEKYGGRYVIDYEDGFFRFSILMPNGGIF